MASSVTQTRGVAKGTRRKEAERKRKKRKGASAFQRMSTRHFRCRQGSKLGNCKLKGSAPPLKKIVFFSPPFGRNRFCCLDGTGHLARGDCTEDDVDLTWTTSQNKGKEGLWRLKDAPRPWQGHLPSPEQDQLHERMPSRSRRIVCTSWLHRQSATKGTEVAVKRLHTSAFSAFCRLRLFVRLAIHKKHFDHA